MVKSKNTLGSDVSVRNMIQVPENINRNSRETIIYTFFKENVFFYLYNAYNKDLYKKLKSKIGVFKIKRSFLFFGRNISQDSIALDLSDTDFL